MSDSFSPPEGRVTKLQTNSPVALILPTVSFNPDELNMTIGG